MLETTLDKLTPRQPEILDSVLQRMKELHAHSATERDDEERIMEGMSSQIMGETTQRAHLALVDQETRALVERAQQEQWSEQQLTQNLTVMRRRIAEEMFKEHWFESTLSTPASPIHAATYGTAMFRYDLRRLMANNPSPEDFQRFGWVRFDVDGLRSFKDCTSHLHTTHFLQQIARIFVNPQGPTRRRLEEQGICVVPMATGGDEFELYLRSNEPLTEAFIGDIIMSYQSEISSSDVLRGFLDFDDERVLVLYGLPSSHQRKTFAALDAEERKGRLAVIRSSLPEQFIPSVAGGRALLTEGILLTVERGKYDVGGTDETFTSLREKIIQGTIDLARDRQTKNKEETLRQLEQTDDRLFQFRLRNYENRRLHEENLRLARELAANREQAERLLGTPQAGQDGSPPQ